jgi:uncharacterized protein YlxW (UPF0749 family)
MMDQYAQQETDTPQVIPPALGLQAQVMPDMVELKWDNKILRVANPEYVRKLAQSHEMQRNEIQQLKERHQQLQQQVSQLQRVVQQLTNTISG